MAGGEIVKNLSDLSVKDDKVSLILTESSASEESERFEGKYPFPELARL